MSGPARYVMVGGFLGAGKTTLLARLAEHLQERGMRVGLITNDQSRGLVDTSLLKGKGFSVEEIAGGCFCCRFHSLDEAVRKLTDDTRPDLFLAEPVGSCTDLLATVSYPLRRIFGDGFSVAPLTVLVDPVRAERIVGLAGGKAFSPKVRYVYDKQLEEARFILINKCDLLDDERRARLAGELKKRYPRAEVLHVSARTGEGLEGWYERVLGRDVESGPTLDIDYTAYAEGEALLGWVNATVAVRAPDGEGIDANALVASLAETIRGRLAQEDVEIAHLKLTLDAALEGGQLAVISIVGSDREADVREALFDRVDGGSLIVNLRAEAAPELLRESITNALRGHAQQALLEVEHVEAFRPAAPVPVHRMKKEEGDKAPEKEEAVS